MTELMLAGLLKIIARNEELGRMVATLQIDIERLEKEKAQSKENKDG